MDSIEKGFSLRGEGCRGWGLDDITSLIDVKFEQTPGDSERQGAWHAAVHGVAELDMT